MIKKPSKKPQFVRPGEVTSTFMKELTMLTTELAQYRLLGSDLAAWFKLNPKASESFGAFQADCAAKRSPK